MNQRDKLIADEVKSAVWEFDPAASVTLFGSRARGDARPDSDYDFLVLFSRPVDFSFRQQVLDRLYQIELEHDCVLGLLIENSAYWEMLGNTPIFSEIEHDGLLV